MADLRPQYSEEAVGANHPTKADIINRAYNVEHEEDGTHGAITMAAPLIMAQGGSGTAGDSIVKGWIQFNGTGVITIQDSYNVSGIVDNGVGDYEITWDTDFANNHYACIGSSNTFHMALVAINTAKIDATTRDAAHNLTDYAQIYLIAIGDQ